MKITRFFAITLAATTLLWSCSKENNPADEPAGRSKLTLNIKGEIDAPIGGKAAGNPTQEDESTINNVMIFVFRADGKNDITPKEITTMPAEGKVSDLEITTDAKEVYVIANTVSNSAVHDLLKVVTKKSELQAVVGRGFDAISATGAPTQTNNNLWMSGKNDAAFIPVKDGKVTVAVTLKYVAAKVRITSVTIDESADPNVAKIVLTNVTIFNGAGATSLIPSDDVESLIPSYIPAASAPFYISGASMTGLSNKPTIVGKNNEYNYNLTGDLAIGTGKNEHYFYVFENDGVAFEKQPTILSLQGIDGESNAINYSVMFKADPDGSLGYDNYIIERGKSYDVAMTIKKLGPVDPTIPALKTTVEVTITPATWKTVTINKTYE